MTGVRACSVSEQTRIEIANRSLVRARTFADMPEGQAFWFENSSGLIELAMNKASISKRLGLAEGNGVELIS